MSSLFQLWLWFLIVWKIWRYFLKRISSLIWVKSFLTECTSGKYGKDCQLDCGHCKNMMQCHHVDGTCVTGCEPGFIGDTCKTGTSEMLPNTLFLNNSTHLSKAVL